MRRPDLARWCGTGREGRADCGGLAGGGKEFSARVRHRIGGVADADGWGVWSGGEVVVAMGAFVAQPSQRRGGEKRATTGQLVRLNEVISGLLRGGRLLRKVLLVRSGFRIERVSRLRFSCGDAACVDAERIGCRLSVNPGATGEGRAHTAIAPKPRQSVKPSRKAPPRNATDSSPSSV